MPYILNNKLNIKDCINKLDTFKKDNLNKQKENKTIRRKSKLKKTTITLKKNLLIKKK